MYQHLQKVSFVIIIYKFFIIIIDVSSKMIGFHYPVKSLIAKKLSMKSYFLIIYLHHVPS